jgi:geranylgeranyl transferase type-1 subunit beta
MTYTALVLLIILGDDLKRVDSKSIIKSLVKLQQPNGSFTPWINSSENDVRFLYCACIISYILNDWSGINLPLALDYITKCQSFDGAFGQAPEQESHGTFN